MLCEKCANISFDALVKTPFSFKATADVSEVAKHTTSLFYFHHCCIPCVKEASIKGCRLCDFFMARLHIGGGGASNKDGLCAALDLPGAGVWVILTQDSEGLTRSEDGRRFNSRTQASKWTQSFTVHYDTISAPIDLVTLSG